MSAGSTFIINTLNDAGAVELCKNLDPKQLLEFLFKNNPGRLFEIFQTGVQLHADYQAAKASQTEREAIDNLMKTLPQKVDEFKAVPQIKKSLKELESISKTVQQQQIRVSDGSFNASPVYTALFKSVALGGNIALPLLGLDAAINRLSNGLSGMRDELAIESVAQVQGWHATDSGYGAYIHKFVLDEMMSYPGPGRGSRLAKLRRLGRKLGKAARAAKAAKVDRIDKVDEAGRHGKTEKTARAGKVDRVDKVDKTGKTDKAHKPSKGGKTDTPEKSGQMVRVSRSIKTEKPVRTDRPVKTSDTPSTVPHHPYHYFYVWHPGTDWYPDFEKKLKRDPLPSNFGGYSHDLATLCLWMSLNREVLKKTTPHGDTAVFHLLVPTYYPIVPEVPIMFHPNLFPLTVTSQRLRQEDLVGFDVRGERKGLTLQCIKELQKEADPKAAFQDMLSSGQMVGSVACSIVSTVFPPASPILTPAVVAMIGTGMTAIIGAVKTLMYQSIAGEGTIVLGQPTLVDTRKS